MEHHTNRPPIKLVIYLLISLSVIFGLARWWLPVGYVISGHDSGLPLETWEFFKSRFYAWNENIGFGVDYSHLFGSLTLHLIDLASSWIVGTQYAGNWFNIFFWLGAVFTAGFILAYQFRDIFGEWFVILFPVVIVVNFYIFQAIFMLERAKYSVLVGILLFLVVILKLFNSHWNVVKSAIISSIIFWLFNGGSLLGLPLFGSLFSIIISLFIFYLIQSFVNHDPYHLKRLMSCLLLTALFWGLLNSYQWFPYLQSFLNKGYFNHLGTGSISQSKDWVDYISKNTSLLNLFRLQGVPNWYSDLMITSSDHPYAQEYTKNGLFVFISFMFPMIAILGFLLSKDNLQKHYVLWFAWIALISMPFTAGTHTPFGSIYAFLYQYFPGFFIFRTPYYKFAAAFFIGFAGLFSAGSSLLISKISSKKTFVSMVAGTIFLCLWLGYHYNLFLYDKIFTWKTNFSTRLKVPDYVWEFVAWNRVRENKESRILLVPHLRRQDFVDGYQWGYWSLSPLTYTLSSVKGLVDEADLTSEENTWLGKIYEAIDLKNEQQLTLISTKLGIKYLLLRQDVINSDNMSTITNNLNNMTNLRMIKKFDRWLVFKILGVNTQKIELLSSLNRVPDGNSYLSRELFSINNVVEESFAKNTIVNSVIDRTVRTYPCQSCLLERIIDNINLPPVRVFPNSPMYFIKERREQENLQKQTNDNDLIFAYLDNVLRRSSEIRSMFILAAEDHSLIKNIDTVNEFLEESLRLLGKHSESFTDYILAKNILDITNPLLKEMRKLVLTTYVGSRNIGVRRPFYDLIDHLGKFSESFSSITKDPDFLRNNKVYFLGLEKTLYLDARTLPKDLNGQVQLPRIYFQAFNQKTELRIEDSRVRWMKIDNTSHSTMSGVLTLQFELVDLFTQEKSSLESFPSGPRACISGKIKDFNSSKTYEVSVAIKSKAQQLGLYFQTNNSNNELRFSQQENVYPIEISQLFRYLYKPDISDRSVAVFLCTEDRDYPEIRDIKIHEISDPNLYAIDETKPSQISSANINYLQDNPARFVIKINNSTEPTIIKFNERFSPFWKLYKISSTKQLTNKFSWLIKKIFSYDDMTYQFPIDGYANAWVVNATGNTTWILEYVPQEFFYLGLSITIFSIITILFIFIIYEKK